MSDKPDSQESSPNRDPNDLPGHDPLKDPINGEADVHTNPEGAAPAVEAVEKEPTLEERLILAEARAEEFKDLYARGQAEVQNIRRRAQDDVSKAHKFAIESFAESLLPVCDSLDMSLKLENLTMDSLKEGVQATLRQLASALEKNKVIELNPLGEKLDPNRHQAISMVPGATLEPPIATGHVVSVLQKGYLINDRLLRPALVTVAQ
jgi:molecular chaperone GrpE